MGRAPAIHATKAAIDAAKKEAYEEHGEDTVRGWLQRFKNTAGGSCSETQIWQVIVRHKFERVLAAISVHSTTSPKSLDTCAPFGRALDTRVSRRALPCSQVFEVRAGLGGQIQGEGRRR